MNNRFVVLLTYFYFIFMFGCTSSSDGTFKNINGQIITASESEIIKNQEILLKAQYPEGLPETAKGSIIFDGIVNTTQITRDALNITNFQIKKILYGTLEDEKAINIYSPPIGKGGIDFKVGETYRVMTVKMDGAYRTWNWTGTVKISEKN